MQVMIILEEDKQMTNGNLKKKDLSLYVNDFSVKQLTISLGKELNNFGP